GLGPNRGESIAWGIPRADPVPAGGNDYIQVQPRRGCRGWSVYPARPVTARPSFELKALMVINVQSEDSRCVLRLQGRLDANLPDHVAKAMEAAIRAGQHELDLDFAEVSYISSA